MAVPKSRRTKRNRLSKPQLRRNQLPIKHYGISFKVACP